MSLAQVKQKAHELGQPYGIAWDLIFEAILLALQNCDDDADAEFGQVVFRVKLASVLRDDGQTRREARRNAKSIAKDAFDLPADQRRQHIEAARDVAA